MAKRSKDTLTGGTGDVNPQYACIALVTPAVPGGGGTVVATVPIVLPVLPNLGGTQDTAQVVEILKVFWDLGNMPGLANGSNYCQVSGRLAFNANTAGSTSTTQVGISSIGNPLMIDEVSSVQQYLITLPAGQSSAAVSQEFHNLESDLTDGAGHGILVAVPTIWFGLAAFGGPAGYVAGGACRVLYRLKRVKLIEYIGIVQQQSGPQI